MQDEPTNEMPLALEISLVTLAFISSFISLLVPALYYLQRKCREHPTPLIAIISLLEALSNFNVILISLNIYQVQQMVHIKYLFDVITFHEPREPSEAEFCQINFMIYILLQLLSIAYNICFSADLLLTLEFPFLAGKRRMKFYHLFSLLFAVVALPLSYSDAKDICLNQFHDSCIYKVPMAFIISLLVFYLMSFVIMILSFRKRQEIPIRKKYIKHHRLILLTLVLVWLFPLLNNIFLMLDVDTNSEMFMILNDASFLSLIISGGIVNVVRFYNDPYIWQQIKKMMKFKKKRRRQGMVKEEESTEDVWNLPLANAVTMFQNQEVISNIIQIVLETCTEVNQESQESMLSQKKEIRFSNPHYKYESTVLSSEGIKQILTYGNVDRLKKVVKVSKQMEMFLSNEKETTGKLQKSVFSVGPNSTQSMQGPKNEKVIKISVTSFADPVFLSLREKDGLHQEQLKKTLDLLLNSDRIRQSRESLGASGSFFFFSFDHKLVIKTIMKSQVDVLLHLLPYYYHHMYEHPNSLLSRFYGLFSVEIAGISKIYFLMMENTFEEFENLNISYQKYDLKGSTKSREVKDKRADVLKDINYLHSNDVFLLMEKDRKEELFDQIKADITLLKSHNLMDYSLLMGVGKPGKRESYIHEDGWRYFTDGSELTNKVYSISIIDYLQEFNMNKYMELMLKKAFKGGGDISSIDTSAYYDRFLAFIRRIIVVYNKE